MPFVFDQRGGGLPHFRNLLVWRDVANHAFPDWSVLWRRVRYFTQGSSVFDANRKLSSLPASNTERH